MEPDSPIPAALIDVLRGDSGIAAGILYGSAARGRLRPGSDVDIAILNTATPPGRGASSTGLLDLLGRLSALASRDVHLVDLRSCDSALRRSIFSSGVVLFDRSGHALRALERSTLVEYADWDYARRVIDGGQRRRLERIIG